MLEGRGGILRVSEDFKEISVELKRVNWIQEVFAVLVVEKILGVQKHSLGFMRFRAIHELRRLILNNLRPPLIPSPLVDFGSYTFLKYVWTVGFGFLILRVFVVYRQALSGGLREVPESPRED